MIAERWKPPSINLDLNLILADDTKGTIWILDAKNANPTNDQLHKMRSQIQLLRKEPKLTDGRPVSGVIVHRKRQLEHPIQPTEHPNILRATIQRLPDLLLAKRLPGSGREERRPSRRDQLEGFGPSSSPVTMLVLPVAGSVRK